MKILHRGGCGQDQGYHRYEIFETWDDLKFPAASQRINPSNVHPEYDYDIGGLLFRHTNTDTSFMLAQLPHSWVEGTEMRPHVHWTKTTAAAGGVTWRLRYRWAPIGEVFAAEWTESLSSVTVGGTPDDNAANRHLISRFDPIPADPTKTISDMLILQLSRVHNDGDDTYGASARLLEFDIHFQNGLYGSVQEFIK